MPSLEVRDIVMEFPAVRALDGVSLSFAPGEVHGIIGENGAGKSTLMKILSGVQSPTQGEVLLDGQPVHFKNVREALNHGIAMIHQELDVIDDLTVAENVFLGGEKAKFGWLKQAEMNAKTEQLLKRVGADFPPNKPVEELSIAGKQLVEIAKALSHEASILIMDEPTAVLTDRETESLFALIRALCQQGTTILYISHRLVEIEEICDRVTVLRDGQFVETVGRGEFDQAQLARLMVGRELGDFYPDKPARAQGEMVLEVSDLASPGHVKGASLQIRTGEIVGIAGLIGAGRTEFAEAIIGARPITSGEIKVSGQTVKIKNVRQANKHGIAYVSEDRKGCGLVLDMDVVENTTISNLREYCTPLLSPKAEVEKTEAWKKELDIRAGNLRSEIVYLSGGNQQKVAIAKWLEISPKVLILDEPTRGVDVGAKREIYRLIHDLADRGTACIVISSELPEIIGVCSRVLVMRDGRVAGELIGEEMNEESIMLLAAGVGAA